ncbi:MAG: beta-N-acetylhexosaminidase [Candidatus Brocadiia bacterium]
MRVLNVDVNACPEELRSGLREVIAHRPERFSSDGTEIAFRALEGGSGPRLVVTWEGPGVVVEYARVTDAFRAVGRLLGGADPDGRDFEETAHFDTLGVMVDVSRNGVLRPEAARAMMRRLALMGVNMLMLYAEDTYEVPGEPFFGYLRGRYTQAELRELDDYAHALGIEMVPCIQTLAHLEQVLQWPAYADYRDTRGIIIAEEESTYDLVEKLIDAASGPFRSDRIHLGMDEAHGIGSGRYRRLHGEKDPFEILNDHLDRVLDICRDRGLRPMIWSDMYFRLGSDSNDYYDLDSRVPPEVAEDIPRDVQLVYWDYYHCELDFYASMIDKHRDLGSEPVMAGGVWTWNHFWAALPYSFTTTEACMMACKQQGLREAFVTLWGDDGMECDVFSALPGIQYFAEHGYADEVDGGLLKANFRGSCEADFDAWVRAAEVDTVPCLAEPERSHTNVSKWLLWQDPLLGFLDPLLDGVSLREHYGDLADDLEASDDERLKFPAQLARTLALKCDLRRDMVAAYQAEDEKRLWRLLKGDLADLRYEVERLWMRHRDIWMASYKPFGWETVERRYGGLRARLKTMAGRIEAYLAGQIRSIPEFEAEVLRFREGDAGHLPVIGYQRAATPSCIK